MTSSEIRSFKNSLACKPEDAAIYEVALQLAELNEKLEPARLVKTIWDLQVEIEKLEEGKP